MYIYIYIYLLKPTHSSTDNWWLKSAKVFVDDLFFIDGQLGSGECGLCCWILKQNQNMLIKKCKYVQDKLGLVLAWNKSFKSQIILKLITLLGDRPFGYIYAKISL